VIDSAVRKARRRIVPLLFLVYIVAYLDRINVGFAALQMNAALGFSASVYGFGAGIFFLGYVVFEIPSNLILSRVGARLWIARIMITWGLVSAATMFVRTAPAFYALRFLLGVAEAGFFPGIIYYLTQWFPARERAQTIAVFMTAVLAAGIIGGPISGALLTLHGAGGLAGWQWLFLLEGIPAAAWGVIVLVAMPDGPTDAVWLSGDERRALLDQLADEARRLPPEAHRIGPALASPRVWLMAVVYFTIPVALYGMGFWLPQILEASSGAGTVRIGMLSALPYGVGALGMIVSGRHSDRTGERRWHVALGAIAGGVAFALAGLVGGTALPLALLSIAMLGLAAMFGPFWSLATSFVGGAGAAAGIALINSVGNIGGFVGPYAIGAVKDATGGYTGGLIAVGAVVACGGALVLAVRDDVRLAPLAAAAAGGRE
jgi:ACS family tartrate transporter-like MFS transporter